MNDISKNPYLKNRYCSLNEYSLNAFLFRDLAVERTGDADGIKSAIAEILAAHGFNINLLGFKFLIALTARYLINSDYSESVAIQNIADIYGTITRIVRDSIIACVEYNARFIKTASESLDSVIEFDRAVEVSDITEIIGALFKIKYNFIADNELTDNGKRAVNFAGMNLNNG